MIWVAVMLAIVGLAMLATGVAALRTARRALDRAAVVELLLTDAADQMVEMEARVENLNAQQRGITGELARLNVRQARLDGGGARHGFDEAIALTRHGADTHELVDTCGLSPGEARLIEVLYGRTRETVAGATDSPAETH